MSTRSIFGAELLHQRVVQIVTAHNTGDTTTTTEIPSDDTKPQKTEGVEWGTLDITPQATANSLFITFDIFAETTSGENWAVALFRDSDTNAICAVATGSPANGLSEIRLEHDEVANTAGAITFKVRAGLLGSFSGKTLFLNRNSAGSLFSTAKASSLRIVEFENG